MRSLYAKGMLGISNYNPGVEGITPNGTAMNPQMAAFFAAQNAQRSKDAYGAMGQGPGLSQQSHQAVRHAVGAGEPSAELRHHAQQVAGPAPRAASNLQLVKGVGDILKNTGVLQKIPGMIGSGIDWLSQATSKLQQPVQDAEWSVISASAD
jgi:hypothetical protein